MHMPRQADRTAYATLNLRLAETSDARVGSGIKDINLTCVTDRAGA